MRSLRTPFVLQAASACLFTCAAHAQDAPAAAPSENVLRVVAEHQDLTGGYGAWDGLALRGTWRATPADLLGGELVATRRYGQRGFFASVSDTHVFSPDWFGSLALGAGDGAFYLPRYRVDATLSRKLLPARNLVATMGAGYYRAPDGHSDRTLLASGTYYFALPWVLEAGVRFNTSNPGHVRTSQRFVALTWTAGARDTFTARHAWGGEGYLATGAATQLVGFRSQESAIGWQHRIAPRTILLVEAVSYRNPLYRRRGASLGLAVEF